MESKHFCIIAICTYQRPIQLSKAIEAVKALIVPDDLEVKLLVVDNNPTDAKSVFEQSIKNLQMPSDYLEVQKRGIVNARNAALEYVIEKEIDFMAFFDDDDYPDPLWLKSLWSCKKTYDSEVVVGRMSYRWPQETDLDDDIKRLYDNALGTIETGSTLKKCGSGNTFIDLDFIKKHELRFHPQFNLTGGEDSHFFENMTRLGATITWCNEAIINSDIEVSRANEKFVIGRRYNVGYTRYKSDALIYGRPSAIFKSLRYCMDVWIRCLFDLFRSGPKVRARSKRRIAEAQGRIDAMRGFNFESYRNSDGG